MTDLKRKAKSKFVFEKRKWEHFFSSIPETNPFPNQTYEYDNLFFQKKVELNKLEELAELQSEVNNVKLEEKLGKQGFLYDTNESFELVTKTVADTSRKLLRGLIYNKSN